MPKIEIYHYLKPKVIDIETFVTQNHLLCYELGNFGISSPFVCENGIFVTGSVARAFGYRLITGNDYPYDHHDQDYLTVEKSRVYDGNGKPVEMRRIATRGVDNFLRRTQFNIDQVLTDGIRLYATEAFVEGMKRRQVVFSELYSGVVRGRGGLWEFNSQKGLFRFLLMRIMWGLKLDFTFPEINEKKAKWLINRGIDRKELEKYIKGSKFHGLYEEFKMELSALGLTI